MQRYHQTVIINGRISTKHLQNQQESPQISMGLTACNYYTCMSHAVSPSANWQLLPGFLLSFFALSSTSSVAMIRLKFDSASHHGDLMAHPGRAEVTAELLPGKKAGQAPSFPAALYSFWSSWLQPGSLGNIIQKSHDPAFVSQNKISDGKIRKTVQKASNL